VAAADKTWAEFPLTSQKHERVSDAFGAGERLVVIGKSGTLTKAISVMMYDEFPAMAFFDVQYTNTGTTKLAIKRWTNNAYTLNAQRNGGTPAFWSYQSGSYEKRPNWVVPLNSVLDHVNGTSLGTLSGRNARLSVEFDKHLLLEVRHNRAPGRISDACRGRNGRMPLSARVAPRTGQFIASARQVRSVRPW
jgi:hypothetical protein